MDFESVWCELLDVDRYIAPGEMSHQRSRWDLAHS
jgi:hypothetical protein